jgi:hypothetical protein
MHRLQLSPTDAGKLVPTHQYGKLLKYYHPKYVRSEENGDDSLYNPKVGVLVRKKFHGKAIPWNDLGDARREIEETLVNLLAWSNVPASRTRRPTSRTITSRPSSPTRKLPGSRTRHRRSRRGKTRYW